jgi:hypothetical protein
MRALIYILLCLFAVFPSLSCVKKVTIELRPFEKRLVVHGYIASGELFNVTVGRTVRDSTFGTDTYLTNALVLLYENGVLKDTLRYQSADDNYASEKVRAEIGKSYTIKVEAEGYPSVEATTTGPSAPVLQSLKHIPKARKHKNGSILDDVEFTFQDPANERNYYLTSFFPANSHSSGGWDCVYSADPVIEREKSSLLPLDESDCIKSKAIIFTDKAFDGQSKMIRISSDEDDFKLIPIPPGIPIPKRLPYLKRYAIDSLYYDYFKFATSHGSGDDLPFVTENTEKKGNIINGYGIFTIFDLRVDSIR